MRNFGLSGTGHTSTAILPSVVPIDIDVATLPPKHYSWTPYYTDLNLPPFIYQHNSQIVR